jgi:hypothetical protein
MIVTYVYILSFRGNSERRNFKLVAKKNGFNEREEGEF